MEQLLVEWFADLPTVDVGTDSKFYVDSDGHINEDVLYKWFGNVPRTVASAVYDGYNRHAVVDNISVHANMAIDCARTLCRALMHPYVIGNHSTFGIMSDATRGRVRDLRELKAGLCKLTRVLKVLIHVHKDDTMLIGRLLQITINMDECIKATVDSALCTFQNVPNAPPA